MQGTRIRPARTPGLCDTDGCNKRRWKQGFCQVCARAAGLKNFPRCGAEGCDRQAQTASEGSLCRPCRAEAKCVTEGCPGAPRADGMCRACERGDNPTVCEIVGCGNVTNSHRRCQKHSRNPDKCVSQGCKHIAVDNGVCARCLTDSPRYCCRERCGSPRFKARLCYKHYRDTITVKCGYPLCNDKTEGVYCADHDMGVDFAAGDWFDWVAAERLFQGQLGGRKPTVPELREALRMADMRHVSHTELGRRLGIGEDLFYQWTRAVYRLTAERAA